MNEKDTDLKSINRMLWTVVHQLGILKAILEVNYKGVDYVQNYVGDIETILIRAQLQRESVKCQIKENFS